MHTNDCFLSLFTSFQKWVPRSHHEDLVAPAKQVIQTMQLLSAPFPATRYISFAASSASHNGTMHSGINRPPLEPHHSSIIQSLYACTHNSPSSRSSASENNCPQNLGSLESIMMLQRGLYPYPPNELWGRNSFGPYRRTLLLPLSLLQAEFWAGNHLFDLVALIFKMPPSAILSPVPGVSNHTPSFSVISP